MSTAVVATGAIVVGLLVVAYMSTHHQDPGPVLTILSSILAGVFVGAKVDGQGATLDKHSTTLAQVDGRLNGQLDARIHDALAASMAQHVLRVHGQDPPPPPDAASV